MSDQVAEGRPGGAPEGATGSTGPSGRSQDEETAPSGGSAEPTGSGGQQAGGEPISGPSTGDRPEKAAGSDASGDDAAAEAAPRSRRRGSRGGRSRSGSSSSSDAERSADVDDRPSSDDGAGSSEIADDPRNPEMPPRISEERVKDPAAAEKALVRRPQVGDTRPAPAPSAAPASEGGADSAAREGGDRPKRRRRGGRGRSGGSRPGGEDRPEGPGGQDADTTDDAPAGGGSRARDGAQRSGGGKGGSQGQGQGSGRSGGERQGSGNGRKRGGRKGEGGQGGSRKGDAVVPVAAGAPAGPVELDEETLESRRGRQRNGKPVGRYLMVVSTTGQATQIAVLEGRRLIEHHVSRPSDDVTQVHGNIYLGRVQNVLPGMEAAFVDIGTPKNAVLYRSDVQYDAEDIEEKGSNLRIEQILKPRQMIICQVTKNPIAHKGARLTQEVSLPGRFVVLIPNSTTYGISKRLTDDERKRLRGILDGVKPEGHGIIVRTAAENVTAEEIQRDVLDLLGQWKQVEELASTTTQPSLLYREPDMAVRVIREEFNKDYRGVVIDDPELFTEVKSYVSAVAPALADRVELFDREKEGLSIFERHHVHEQLHKALDRKVWLPSGGSLIIEATEALTVIDVNTGKNVGKSSLEETVFRNNLEAAEEIAKQLRLRDIGGIIVIDFIDMEVKKNRDEVIALFRDCLARDKTRTQVFDISELGLVEMTRKRIGEGLVESLSHQCPECEGRGLIIDEAMLT